MRSPFRRLIKYPTGSAECDDRYVFAKLVLQRCQISDVPYQRCAFGRFDSLLFQCSPIGQSLGVRQVRGRQGCSGTECRQRSWCTDRARDGRRRDLTKAEPRNRADSDAVPSAAIAPKDHHPYRSLAAGTGAVVFTLQQTSQVP